MLPGSVFAQDAVLEAMTDYTDFATYDAGVIVPAQVTSDLFESFVFIDTRTAEEFAESTIEGAIHIEWRTVFSRIDEIPKNQKNYFVLQYRRYVCSSRFRTESNGLGESPYLARKL
ncbi:rhodanese-like domain-containing protein [Falsihalocynthiibacter sp. CO-5D18]|uniref:rhodanese-like domain-containing protein n=1 Tax=Falsihalocynthiibacter sp. CO-5D18 TaxID=3240872 RepID=UPI00351014B8